MVDNFVKYFLFLPLITSPFTSILLPFSLSIFPYIYLPLHFFLPISTHHPPNSMYLACLYRIQILLRHFYHHSLTTSIIISAILFLPYYYHCYSYYYESCSYVSANMLSFSQPNIKLPLYEPPSPIVASLPTLHAYYYFYYYIIFIVIVPLS